MSFRIGLGYDIHRLIKGRPLILGGVHIPYNRGLEGHSDADCLTHAISDAILGAAGLRDIGHYFPNTDPQYKDINSQKILYEAYQKAKMAGFSLINIDATLIAEAPKIEPYIEAIKATLSQTLVLPPRFIGIKATTNEKMGALGRGIGIATQAVCLLGSAD